MANRKTCFVIAPIGEAESETRRRSDQVLKHVIRPAVAERGYEALRADEISEPGLITSQVIQHIVDDPLVIADLTERNPNVFYELAIRHALRKPLVQLIRKGELIPFDVAGTRTIHVDHHDLDSVEAAKVEIVKQVCTLEKDASQLDTPISVALDLQLLRQSDNPERRSLADVVSSMAEMRAELNKVSSKLSDPETLFPTSAIYRALKQLAGIRNERLSTGLIEDMRHLCSRIEEVGSKDDKELAVKLSDRLAAMVSTDGRTIYAGRLARLAEE